MYDIFSTRTVPQCPPILHRKLLFELAWAVMPCSAFGIGNYNRATHCVGVAPGALRVPEQSPGSRTPAETA
jgi:hypothetical protein